jgi:hypothetical protein
VDGKEEHTAAEGVGPVSALDRALRKSLITFFPCIKDIRLTDYKVRVLNPKGATDAKVRVLIESSDGHDTWGTVGVSENLIEASWQALVDSITYKLKKEYGYKRKECRKCQVPGAGTEPRKSKLEIRNCGGRWEFDFRHFDCRHLTPDTWHFIPRKRVN